MSEHQFITSGAVKDGKLQLRGQKQFVQTFATWPDCEVIVTVERRHATRSQLANRYYWGVVVAYLAEHTGFTPDEMHDVLKAKFLPKSLAVTDRNGEIQGEYVIGGSTTKLNKLEFGDYCRRIKQWALDDLGVDIPEPSRWEAA